MGLYISAICSGSNGNCYYIGNDDEAVLIDAGISCREIEKRMLRNGLSIQKVKAVFISHEHTDHTFGIKTLSSKYKLPVYTTEIMCRHSKPDVDASLIHYYTSYQVIEIGGLKITAFPKMHDACDPHSFVISNDDVCIGVFTDIGKACDRVIRHFKQCHAVFLESNYDTNMLMNGRYPYHLKRRISGDHGHLSNDDALQLFLQHRPHFLSHLILSHLSQNNNKPEIVNDLFSAHAYHTRVVVASRYQETEVFYINQPQVVYKTNYSLPKPKVTQLSIF